MGALRLFSDSITPVVLISACGLVTPALYSRLGEILARIRAFHHQKIELLKNLNQHEVEEQELLLEMLDLQIDAVVVKARVIKKALYCLLVALAAFLLCFLFAQVAVIFEWAGIVALGMGFLALTSFFVGLGWAMRELLLSLTPMEEERAILKTVTAHYLAKSNGGKRLKISDSA